MEANRLHFFFFFDRKRKTATPHIDKENPRRGNVPGGGGGGWVSPTAPGTGGARLHTLCAKSIYHFDVRKNDITQINI